MEDTASSADHRFPSCGTLTFVINACAPSIIKCLTLTSMHHSTFLCTQVSQMLPLALWDGRYGVMKILPSSFQREVLCKLFTVAALGVFQPFLLLLGCFLCTHALRCGSRSTDVLVWLQAQVSTAVCTGLAILKLVSGSGSRPCYGLCS